MSARALTAGVLASINSGHIKPLFLVDVEFKNGSHARLFTGYGEIQFNGHTWTGGGHLLRISAVQEVSELNAINFTVSINGNVTELAQAALAQVQRGRPGTVWLGFLDANNELIADPYIAFSGRAD